MTLWPEIDLGSQGISNLIYHTRDKYMHTQYARSIYKRKRKSLKAFPVTGQINGMRNVLWFQQILKSLEGL